jgi:magnesium-transporting ATPase (P-type)
MEAALHAWSLRVGSSATPEPPVQLRLAYTADRMLSSVVVSGRSIFLGAPEAVLSRCLGSIPHDVVDDLAERGRRVLAVAEGHWRPGEPESNCETALMVLALIGFEDPPRPDVAEALAACRTADIKVAMVTGDHPGTAAAVAREVGLLGERGVVLDAGQLPKDDGDMWVLPYLGSSSASPRLPGSSAAPGRPHSAGPWPSAPCRSLSSSMLATRLCVVVLEARTHVSRLVACLTSACSDNRGSRDSAVSISMSWSRCIAGGTGKVAAALSSNAWRS